MVNRKFLISSILILILILPIIVAAEEKCLYYFYGDDCKRCRSATDTIDQLEKTHPDLKIHRFEVYYNRDNARLLEKYFQAYNVQDDSAGVPVVFLADSYLVGSSTIETLLEGQLDGAAPMTCPSLYNIHRIGIVGSKDPESFLGLFTLGRIGREGIVRGFSPEALTLALILLLLLAKIPDNKIIERSGIFLGAVLGTYILFSVGLLNSPGILATVFYKGLGVLGLLYGLYGIRKFLRAADEKREVEESENKKKWRTKTEQIVHFIISPFGLIITGFLSGFLSLGSLTPIILLLQTHYPVLKFSVLAYLIQYVFFSIIPLVLIIFFIHQAKHQLASRALHKGQGSDMNLIRWKLHANRVFHFSVSCGSLFLGFILLVA